MPVTVRMHLPMPGAARALLAPAVPRSTDPWPVGLDEPVTPVRRALDAVRARLEDPGVAPGSFTLGLGGREALHWLALAWLSGPCASGDPAQVGPESVTVLGREWRRVADALWDEDGPAPRRPGAPRKRGR